MIETMKVVTLVASSKKKNEMLTSLRDAGLLHIKELKKTCEASEQKAQRIHSLMTVLNAISDEGDRKKEVKQENLDSDSFSRLHEEILRALDAKKKAEDEHVRLAREIGRISAWGDFDPSEVRALRGQGFDLSFYTLDEKALDRLREDENVRFICLSDVGRQKAVACLGSRPDPLSGAREFTLPEKSLSALEAEDEECLKTIRSAHELLVSSDKYTDEYRRQIKLLDQESMFERVKATSRDEDDAITLITGYVPEDRSEDVKALAKANGWAYLVDDVSDEDNPPTKLRYKGLVRIIQPIYDILGTVPGYREYDISSWFLLFFSVFFAMIIGDAGYGLIFLIIAIVMNVKAKKCSDINILLYFLSGTTIVYGAVTGTWFGSLTVLEKLPFLQVFIIPSICNYSVELYGIDSVYAQNNVMQFCFILGAAQLGLACVINVINKAKVKDLSLLGDIGWLIDVCVLYMMALYLVIGAEVNFSIVIAGVAVGFALVVVFGSQSPGQSFASGLKSGLGGFFTSFLDTVSCFSNIMSYIRLFAVGMASLAIAQSFNNMAGMAGPVFGFLIVILGTLLNIVMGLLSVVVHGVRLNLLEFSGQLGMEWTGYKYDPFRKTVETNETNKELQK